MMETKKEVRNAIGEALASELDTCLTQHGFGRRTNSLDYSRRCAAGQQFLRMGFQFRPEYQPGADAHIYPDLLLVFPELNRLALRIVDGRKALLGDPDITLSQPIDIAIPKDRHIRWFTCGRDSVFQCVRSIRASVTTWTIPFLDEYATLESLIRGYEEDDNRLLIDRPFCIYVAGAYVLLNQPSEAMHVLETEFGRPGARRQYAKAFEYVGSLLASNE